MPIRIKLFFLLLSVSLAALVMLIMTMPHFSQILFIPAGVPALLMIFLLVVLITFTSIIVAIHFTLPLTKLREITRQVQFGEFTKRASTVGKDEVTDLAQSFNTMLDQLQSNQAGLQKAVAEATHDLAEKLQDLEHTKQATLNILEDLEEVKGIIEIEKIKAEAILASIGDGIVALDKDGKVMVINQAGCTLLGFKAEELLGKKFIAVVVMVNEKGEIIPEDKRPFHAAMADNKPTTTTTTGPIYYYIRKDGTRFPVALTVTPIISGQTMGAIAVFRDIGREIEIDKAKSEFVSLASHQLRTPLGIIKWYLGALQNEHYFAKAPVVIHEYVDEIYKSNERVLALVRDLLSVSRIDQGQIKNTPVPVDLMQSIGEINNQLQIVARKKGVALQITIEDQHMPFITIDKLRFHEVVENLILNAVDYTMTGGSVWVSVYTGGRTLFISVKDTGIGIAASEQSKLFTKFFRSTKAVEHKPEGSGLGLYVAKSYVEGWGGTIAVTSIEGQGSTFTISLPMLKKDINNLK